MKVIDLLNKIANGEEMPKKIKYKNELFEYDNDTQDYYIVEGTYDYLFRDSFCKKTNSFINDKVEIIEEPKKIEKLGPVRGSDLSDLTDKDMVLRNNALIELCKTLNNMNNKINELIDEVNRLKGEK